MTDEIARDEARSAALANAAVMAHLLRAFVGRGILTEQRVFDLLHEAELDLLSFQTIPGAMGAGHISHIRDAFQTAAQSRHES
jgi:hypothetical protein